MRMFYLFFCYLLPNYPVFQYSFFFLLYCTHLLTLPSFVAYGNNSSINVSKVVPFHFDSTANVPTDNTSHVSDVLPRTVFSGHVFGHGFSFTSSESDNIPTAIVSNSVLASSTSNTQAFVYVSVVVSASHNQHVVHPVDFIQNA